MNDAPNATETLAEGVWCRDCEFFEEPNYDEGWQCQGCGCGEPRHVRAAVRSLGGVLSIEGGE